AGGGAGGGVTRGGVEEVAVVDALVRRSGVGGRQERRVGTVAGRGLTVGHRGRPGVEAGVRAGAGGAVVVGEQVEGEALGVDQSLTELAHLGDGHGGTAGGDVIAGRGGGAGVGGGRVGAVAVGVGGVVGRRVRAAAREEQAGDGQGEQGGEALHGGSFRGDVERNYARSRRRDCAAGRFSPQACPA